MSNLVHLIVGISNSIFGIALFVYFFLQLKKVNKNIDLVEERRSEYENLVMKSLVNEFNILNEQFDTKFTDLKEEVISTMNSIKDEKQKLAIEEAIILLQKQDNNWFDKHFTAGVPANESIEQIYKSKYEPNDDRYTQFIEEIRKESEL